MLLAGDWLYFFTRDGINVALMHVLCQIGRCKSNFTRYGHCFSMLTVTEQVIAMLGVVWSHYALMIYVPNERLQMHLTRVFKCILPESLTEKQVIQQLYALIEQIQFEKIVLQFWKVMLTIEYRQFPDLRRMIWNQVSANQRVWS